METIKTIPEQIIPESIMGQVVLSINIEPTTKTARVEVLEGDGPKVYVADLTSEWDTVSDANKTIIKTFLKRVVAITIGANEADITGDAL